MFEGITRIMVVEDSPEYWLVKFLNSSVMQSMEPAQWQRVLKKMRLKRVDKSQRVVRRGDKGDHFFVIKQGGAIVHRHGTILARLKAGDVFGEDAIISNGARNAHVTMVESGELMVLPKGVFSELLVSAVVRFVKGGASATFIDVSDKPGHARGPGNTIHLPLLEFRERIGELQPANTYCVVGGTLAQRALGVFLLIQQGHKAWALIE